MLGRAAEFSHEYPCDSPSQKRWFKMHVAPLLGQAGYFVISHVDTTSSKRQIADSQAALREIDARYQTLIERSPETIIVHQRGIIVYVNPAAVTLYGATSSADLLGTTVLDRIHPDSLEQTRQRINDITHLGISVPLAEMRHVKLDGTPIDVEVNGGSIIFDGQPMFKQFSATSQRVSWQRPRQEKTNCAFAVSLIRQTESSGKLMRRP